MENAEGAYSFGDRLRQSARRLWRWFFPEKISLPEEARAVLQALYPTLDLDAVVFHRGMPHLIRLLGGQAITIPAVFAPRRTRIYVEPWLWRPETVQGLGTLVHEAYHALQVQESRWGLGPFRPFLALYFACGAANGFRYRGHPMEVDAYCLAGNRRSPFEAAMLAAGEGCSALDCCPPLATSTSGLRFWAKLARSTPVVGRLADQKLLILLVSPVIGLWLAAWFLAVTVAWLARVLVEAAGALLAGALWAIGAAVSSVERAFR